MFFKIILYALRNKFQEWEKDYNENLLLRERALRPDEKIGDKMSLEARKIKAEREAITLEGTSSTAEDEEKREEIWKY